MILIVLLDYLFIFSDKNKIFCNMNKLHINNIKLLLLFICIKIIKSKNNITI